MATIAIAGLKLEGSSLLNDQETFLDMLKDDELAGVIGGGGYSSCGSSHGGYSGGGYSGSSYSGGGYSGGGSSFDLFSGFFKSNDYGSSCY